MSAPTLVAPRRARATRTPAAGDAAPPRPTSPRRVLAACTLLLLVYVGLSLLDDPHGTLGTDTGGKLATLSAMEQTGTWIPEVGYWAADLDPTGALHPLYYTFRVGDRWVNVTTLPVVVASRPLFTMGGARAVLLLPMVGGVLCALAARRLARLVAAGRGGWVAFWSIGLCTPVAVYALDFWEHTLGVACTLFGIGLFVEVARADRGAVAALGGGALFGAAAVLRTEALVYLAVAVVVLAAWRLLARDAIPRVAPLVAAAVAGAAAPLVANQALEQLVLGTGLRSTRAAGTAAAAAAGLGHRAGEAAVTSVGMNGFRPPADLVLGAAVAGLVVAGVFLLGFAARRRMLLGAAALAVAGAVVLGRFSGGLGFVPGMLVATPLAAAGAVFGWRVRAGQFSAVTATVALPLVWLVQYQGGARPQWGGRYLLPTAAVLAVLAVVALRDRRAALVGVLAVSALVTGLGIAWESSRSHAVARGMAALVEQGEDRAVVSTVHHVLREGGAFYDRDRHWLTATSTAELRRAFHVVHAAGDREVVVVTPAGRRLPRSVGGYAKTGKERPLEIRPREPLQLVTYRDSPSP